MKIRSITTFLDPGYPVQAGVVAQAGRMSAAARQAFEEAGFAVQTTRLASVPFPRLIPTAETAEVLNFAQTLENCGRANGFEYVTIGPALPEIPASYAVLPDVLAATQNVFASGVIAGQPGGVSMAGVRACAEVIQRCSTLEANGFGNLYFAALANVPAGAPFFPAAYHDGGPAGFALAMEAADLAVEIFGQAGSLAEAREILKGAIERHARALGAIGERLSRTFGLVFRGIDFTLATFPERELSIGTALELLGAPRLGLHGSLAAAAFLTDVLDQAEFQRAGFNGLMLPVLEDATLAQRAAEGTLAVQDLLLYSAVCGTGLDTLPLAGDVTVEQIAALLTDVAALALRLNKPLTARLLPVPGKAAGDLTSFDFPFFANSRIMPLRAAPLGGLLGGTETFGLKRRVSF